MIDFRLQEVPTGPSDDRYILYVGHPTPPAPLADQSTIYPFYEDFEASLNDETDESYVPVRFQSRITELGVFELWCVSDKTDERWKLEFSVRDEPDEADA